MKDYPPDKIRNVVLTGHSGSGKTSLSEALLFAAGATNRLGKVEEGTTVSDWDPDEQKRGFSVNLSILTMEWDGHKVNVLDTPGYADFLGEVKCGLRAAELAIVAVDAASGVQVGTEFAWQFADELELPRAVFVNRMDRDNADFSAALSQLQALWGKKCVALQIPIGSRQAFQGVVDLLTMKAYMGEKGEEKEIPGDLKAQAESLREKLIEAAAETEDALITKYLEGEEMTAEEVAQIGAGDIGAVAKLAETQTGDTLCAKEKALRLPSISFPEPAFSAAVSPKTKADLDKMGSALQRIVEEDPSLRLERNADTGETVLSGMGDSHVEVALEKIRRKFSVDLAMNLPKVPYKETITGAAQAEYTHKKQTGGHGQYARVALEVQPLARGEGFQFANKTVGGVVPKQYVGSVEKGVLEALPDGVLAHYPMVDMKVILFDGREHPVDSSDIAFKIASSMALKKGALDAQPVLLEPIMTMQITVPEANTGDVISDLNGKRARVLGMTPRGTMTTVEAQAPLAEVQRYSADLRSMTQGRGGYRMTFSHYEEVPQHVTQS